MRISDWSSDVCSSDLQIAKQLIVRNLNWYDVVPVLPHLNIVYMKNTGAAFSMMSDASPVLFVLLGVGVSVGILLWLRRHPRDQHLVAIALSLIMGGALGNVIDRVTRGYVVDFVDFYVGRSEEHTSELQSLMR